MLWISPEIFNRTLIFEDSCIICTLFKVCEKTYQGFSVQLKFEFSLCVTFAPLAHPIFLMILNSDIYFYHISANTQQQTQSQQKKSDEA